MGEELARIPNGSPVDWVAVKDVYVCGEIKEDGSLYFPTHVELASRFNTSPSNIGTKSAEGNWSLERSMYIQNLERRKQEKRIEELASQAAEFDTRVLKAARAGLSHIEAHFRAAQILYEEQGVVMRLNDLDRISRTLERYHRVGRLALGESTHNVAASVDSWLDVLNVLEDGSDDAS